MGDIGIVGTMGIVGNSAAPGVGTVGTPVTVLTVLTVVALLVLLVSVWWVPAARWWRARLRRSSGWRRIGGQVGRQVQRQIGRAIARQMGRVPPLRPALAAETLLRQLLSPAEYRQLRRKHYLEVASRGHPGRVYRVPRGGGQVAVVEDGRVVERLCVGPVGHLPQAEVVLVHKLLIEADEEGYLAAANHLRGESTWPAAARAALGPW